LEETKKLIPDYLLSALPTIMKRWARPNIDKFAEYLPKDYWLAFDIETSPASKYLKDMETLMLSEKEWSINRTTKDELKKILAEWVDNWLSYGQIAKQIKETDPFVFSKSRAELIAIQEVGQAYGFANYEPIRVLKEDWYIMEKKWVTSHDWKVRPSHTSNELAGWIPADDEFPWTSDMYAPSRQFRCRCTMTNRIIWVKKEWKNFIKPFIILKYIWKLDNLRVLHESLTKE
jgi:uncharacterized protein with gpF-like domain